MRLRKKMNYPYKKLALPKEVEKVGNGKLTPKMLKKVKTGGVMWTEAADAFNLMYDAALAAGFKLRNVGDFRPFEGQLSMFKDRYSEKDLGRKPQVTRKYEGKTWYLKPGKAPSSTPGNSNHGFGLAIDLGYETKGALTSMGGKCLEWMCANAPKYGFYLQGSDPKSPEFEAWHWQYVCGDTPPAAVSGGASAAPVAAPTSAAPAPSAPAFPGDLDVGSKGASVKLVQAKVGAKADGDFGPGTGAKVSAWREANGLGKGTKVGPKTWKAMFG
jgi:hypothetical protein